MRFGAREEIGSPFEVMCSQLLYFYGSSYSAFQGQWAYMKMKWDGSSMDACHHNTEDFSWTVFGLLPSAKRECGGGA